MSLVDVARDALKEIPMAEVLRERLSLALDRLADAERQIAVLQTDKGGLEAQLERERVDHEQTKKELQRLQEKLHEEVRFIHGVELRRGIRTGGKWLPFCPKCHLPISSLRHESEIPYCNDGACGWVASNTSAGAVWQELKATEGAS